MPKQNNRVQLSGNNKPSSKPSERPAEGDNTPSLSPTPNPTPRITSIKALLWLVRPNLPYDREDEFFHFYLNAFEEYAIEIGFTDANFLAAIGRARAAAKVYEEASMRFCSPSALCGLYEDVVDWFYYDTCVDHHLQTHLKEKGHERYPDDAEKIEETVESWKKAKQTWL